MLSPPFVIFQLPCLVERSKQSLHGWSDRGRQRYTSFPGSGGKSTYRAPWRFWFWMMVRYGKHIWAMWILSNILLIHYDWVVPMLHLNHLKQYLSCLNFRHDTSKVSKCNTYIMPGHRKIPINFDLQIPSDSSNPQVSGLSIDVGSNMAQTWVCNL